MDREQERGERGEEREGAGGCGEYENLAGVKRGEKKDGVVLVETHILVVQIRMR